MDIAMGVAPHLAHRIAISFVSSWIRSEGPHRGHRNGFTRIR
jgi:hypothetical protein